MANGLAREGRGGGGGGDVVCLSQQVSQMAAAVGETKVAAFCPSVSTFISQSCAMKHQF